MRYFGAALLFKVRETSRIEEQPASNVHLLAGVLCEPGRDRHYQIIYDDAINLKLR